MRAKPWEWLFHWVQSAESHRIFYKKTVIGMQYLNSKKTLWNWSQFVAFCFCSLWAKHIILLPGENMGGKFLPARYNFPLKIILKEGYTVGHHCIVSHSLHLFHCGVWFPWLREVLEKNKKAWEIPGGRNTWIHQECISPYCTVVYCTAPFAHDLF